MATDRDFRAQVVFKGSLRGSIRTVSNVFWFFTGIQNDLLLKGSQVITGRGREPLQYPIKGSRPNRQQPYSSCASSSDSYSNFCSYNCVHWHVLR